jgi:hypothetical protein
MDNYDDHVYLSQYNEQHNIRLPGLEAVSSIDYDKLPSLQRFFSICKMKNAKPQWSGHSETNRENQIAAMMELLPTSFKSLFTKRRTMNYRGEFISCSFIPYKDLLPKFVTVDQTNGETACKSYKVPSDLALTKLLDFLYNQLGVKESILDTNRDN